MDQNHAGIFAAKVLKIARAAANEIVDFAGHFCPAESAPNDDETEAAPPFLRIGAHFGPLHLLHDMRAQRCSVPYCLKGQRVIGHARNSVKIGRIAAGEHQVVIRDTALGAFVRFEFDFVPAKINVQHFLGAAKNARQQLAQGHHDIQRID